MATNKIGKVKRMNPYHDSAIWFMHLSKSEQKQFKLAWKVLTRAGFSHAEAFDILQQKMVQRKSFAA